MVERRTRTTLLARLLLLVYALAVVLLALFALSVLRPGNTAIDETDARGAFYHGYRDAVSGDFAGTVQISFAGGAAYTGAVGESGFNGRATYTGADGWTISGNFTDGYLDGEGSYSDGLGNYQGAFKHSQPDGKGLYTSTQGWTYEGDFQAGVITGQGNLTLPDGTIITGNFLNGVYQGHSSPVPIATSNN
jgi:hypothetical protein